MQNTKTAARVKFDSARVTPGPRPFGWGVLRKASGPTAADLAYEAGRAAGLDCEGPVEAPAGYSPTERIAFIRGMAEAASIIDARAVEYYRSLEEDAAGREMVATGHYCW